jgi:hypothetical protein
VGQRIESDAPWMRGISESGPEKASPIPDFAGHSPFGSGEWYVPWNARWNTPVR